MGSEMCIRDRYIIWSRPTSTGTSAPGSTQPYRRSRMIVTRITALRVPRAVSTDDPVHLVKLLQFLLDILHCAVVDNQVTEDTHESNQLLQELPNVWILARLIHTPNSQAPDGGRIIKSTGSAHDNRDVHRIPRIEDVEALVHCKREEGILRFHVSPR